MSPLRRLPAEERGLVLGFFAYFFLTVATTVLGKTARNALFLSRFEPQQLPWAFLAIALVIALALPLYGRLARRVRPRRLTVVTGTVFGLSLLLFAGDPGPARRALLYVWIELGTTLLFFQYWILAGRAFTARQAKRLFGLIGAGAGLANILVGLGLSGAVAVGGTGILVPATAAAALGSVLVAWRLPPARAVEPGPTAEAGPEVDAGEARPYLFWLGLAGAASTIVFVVADYQFKFVAAQHYSEAGMAGLFGLVYAATGAGALATQLLLTGPLLTRRGVRAGMAVLPGSQLIAAILLAVRPTIASAIFLRATDRSFRFTVDQASRQLLWMPLSEGVRQRSKAFVDESVRQVAQGFTGVVILLLGTSATARRLSVVSLPAILVWLVANRQLGRRYLDRLRQAVSGARRFELPLEVDLADPGVRAELGRVLASGAIRERLYVLSLLESVGTDGFEVDLLELWRAGSAREREGVLGLVGDGESPLPPGSVLAAARGDDSLEVRVAATRALGRAGEPRSDDLWRELMSDPVASVRIVAAGNRLAEEPADAVARELLERHLADGPEARDRAAAAVALAATGQLEPSRIARLLCAPDVVVRTALLDWVAEHASGSKPLLSTLLERLQAGAETSTPAHALSAIVRSDGLPNELRPALGQAIEGVAARTDRTRSLLESLACMPPSLWWRVRLRRRLEEQQAELCWLTACLAPGVDDEHQAALRSDDPARRSAALDHLDGVLTGAPGRRLFTSLEGTEAALSSLAGQVETLADPTDDAEVRAELERMEDSTSEADRLVALQYRLARGERPSAGVEMLERLEKAVFIQAVELFAGLDGPEAADAADLLIETRLDAGTVVFEAGSRDNSLFVIRSGRVEVLRDGRRVAELERGDCFGEFAMLDGGARTATVATLEETELLELRREDFLRLAAMHPRLLEDVLSLLTGRIREITAAESTG